MVFEIPIPHLTLIISINVWSGLHKFEARWSVWTIRLIYDKRLWRGLGHLSWFFVLVKIVPSSIGYSTLSVSRSYLKSSCVNGTALLRYELLHLSLFLRKDILSTDTLLMGVMKMITSGSALYPWIWLIRIFFREMSQWDSHARCRIDESILLPQHRDTKSNCRNPTFYSYESLFQHIISETNIKRRVRLIVYSYFLWM